ncbi:MAG: hypothetical protein DI586_04830 [Micavibrio aeruginosavorus]|uniref:Uncharacterized protein n=1 Tax=Micavibrio aeruginosavorus TaxID=349221 RepID=A0A2W5FJG4_9BACT|nr:MAG: hypothetical protein DI586_04830 [Micavibrio aeruginosavorus]
MENTHDPIIGKDKRPHVPIESLTIGQVFRLIENGEAINKPDADYESLQKSLKRRSRKNKAPDNHPAP